jgi:hypothetical protein
MRGFSGNGIIDGFVTILIISIIFLIVSTSLTPMTDLSSAFNESHEHLGKGLIWTLTHNDVSSIVLKNKTAESQTFTTPKDYNITSASSETINFSHVGNFTSYYNYEEDQYIETENARTIFGYFGLLLAIVILVAMTGMVMKHGQS